MMKLLSMGTVFVLALARIDHPDDASLGGRVTDENLAPIASATISARNLLSGEVEYARSDANGLYKFTGMRQGRYSVFAEAEGYGRRWVFNIFLFRGKYTQLDLVLATCRKGVPSDGCTESGRGTNMNIEEVVVSVDFSERCVESCPYVAALTRRRPDSHHYGIVASGRCCASDRLELFVPGASWARLK
jgi:hypothetical protein